MHDIRSAYHYCERYASEHYENFPVASLLIPRNARGHIAAIYAFARIADDFADEGAMAPEERLRNLDAWEAQLDLAIAGKADHPAMVALAETMRVTGVGRPPLVDLLSAFRQDVTRHRYTTFDELLGYCSRSANPIGQMVLTVFDAATPENVSLSNEICTALQLTNFWQDVSLDMLKMRLYIPLEDLERFGYTESDVYSRSVGEGFRDLIRFQVDRTEEMFHRGKSLPGRIPPLRRELNLTWWGGMTILKKIRRLNYDVLNIRPRITLADVPSLIARSFFARRP